MKKSILSSNRVETFTDGVIAIIITILVLEIKAEEVPSTENIWRVLIDLVPKFASYILSFIMLVILWISHHQIFYQIKKVDRKLLWLNNHLLFWMSLVPFGTNLVGENPFLWQSTFLFAMIFFMNAFSFTLLRNHAYYKGLFSEDMTQTTQEKMNKKSIVAMIAYISAAFISILSVYISFGIFVLVPMMYAIGEGLGEARYRSDKR